MCMFWTCQIPLDAAVEEVMRDTELLVLTNFGKVQRARSLHLGFRALQEFKQKYSRLPKPRNQVSNGQPFSMLSMFYKRLFYQIKFGKVGAGENNTSVSELDYHCCKHMPIAFSYHNNCQIFHYGLCVS